MKTLYLRIYLTVVVVLLLFALAAGWLADRRVVHERESVRAAWAERAAAWAQLLEKSLPEAASPADEQRQALIEWSNRLRLPLALDNEHGQRVVTSGLYESATQNPQDPQQRVPLPLPLSDGRTLWVLKPTFNVPPPGGRPPVPPAQWLSMPWFPMPGSELVATLIVLFIAVAVGAFPVVRHLTRRLEQLRRGVETFGSGEFSQRVDERGKDEVAAVAASFNRAAARIESLVRANRSLLANASHELRSPLTRLKMAISLWAGASPERLVALRAEIDQDIRELDALVDEVLLASRLDAQTPMSEEPVEMLGLAAEEAARYGVVADGEPVTVIGDERLLRRAIRNLLENAQRYGASGAISLHVAPSLASTSFSSFSKGVIRIEDQGPGVPPELRDRIFEAFYRLPGHAEMAGGVGLGLSLVRQIARRHGGDARCESRLDGGSGSAFLIELPCFDQSLQAENSEKR